MLRDKSLVPLSHEHQHALALCLLVERALAANEPVHELARKAVQQFDDEIANHFRLEEEVLFPALEPNQTVQDLLEDHRTMRALIEELRSGGDRQTVSAFVKLLRSHVRREENELFEDAQRSLPREKLDEIGRALARQTAL